MKSLPLCTMCGSHQVYRADVDKVETPHPTETWHPIPHATLIDSVQEAMTEAGLKVVQEAHALGNETLRYFGLMQVQAKGATDSDEYGLVLGLRNAHDKRFPAAIALGSGVFVCDNLQFSGEAKIGRKHTRHIMRDLPGVVRKAIGKLGDLRQSQDNRIEAYKRTELTHSQVNDLLIQALDARVIASSKISKVLAEWREPRHPEFSKDGLTAWRLHNAFTEILKATSIFALPAATQKLNGILDGVAGLVGMTEAKPAEVA